MGSALIGKKLWLKIKLRQNTRRLHNFNYKNFFASLFSLTAAILSIYFAYTANTLAKQSNLLSQTAFNLSKNDTSQQSQINKLAAILLELKDQNRKLLAISEEANKINLSSIGILTGSKSLLAIYNQQFGISVKNDSIQDINIFYEKFNDLIAFNQLYEEAWTSFERAGFLRLYKVTVTPDILKVRDVTSKFERVLQSKVVLSDSLLSIPCSTLIDALKDADYQIQIMGPDSDVQKEKVHQIILKLRLEYFTQRFKIDKRIETLNNKITQKIRNEK